MEVERAIGILGNVPLDDKLNPEYIKQVQEAFSVVKTVLERPKGKWRSSSGEYLCDKCFHHFVKTSNFCPNCGDDKRGE